MFRLKCLIVGALALLAGAAHANALDEGEILALQRADGATTRVRALGPQQGCVRTVLFSHGLGGDIEKPSELSLALGGLGWRVLAIEHVESGPAALVGLAKAPSPGEYFRARAGDPHRHQARFADLDAAYAEATRACRPPQLMLIGHSMGATTAMLEAGAATHFGSMGQDRFDAYVALSPRGAGMLFPVDGWRGVKKPMLMVTGPDDASVEGDWRTRLSAFEGLPKGRKRLAIVPRTNHFEMGGFVMPVAATILELVTEFADSAASQAALAPSRVAGIETRDK